MKFGQILTAFMLYAFFGFSSFVQAQSCCDNCPLFLPDGAVEDFNVFVSDEGTNPNTDCAAPLESVMLNFDHMYLGDLEISITSPCGNTAVLVAPVDFTGGTGTYVLTFVDGSANGTWFSNGQGSTTGDFDPFTGTIAGLNCADNCGQWTITVLDDQDQDTGNFLDFALDFQDSADGLADDLGCSNTPPPDPPAGAICDAGNLNTTDLYVCFGESIAINATNALFPTNTTGGTDDGDPLTGTYFFDYYYDTATPQPADPFPCPNGVFGDQFDGVTAVGGNASVEIFNLFGGQSTGGALLPTNQLISVSGSVFDDSGFVVCEEELCATGYVNFVLLDQISVAGVTACDCTAGGNPIVTIEGITGGLPSYDGTPYVLQVEGATPDNFLPSAGDDVVLTLNEDGGDWSVTITDLEGCEFFISGSCSPCCEADAGHIDVSNRVLCAGDAVTISGDDIGGYPVDHGAGGAEDGSSQTGNYFFDFFDLTIGFDYIGSILYPFQDVIGDGFSPLTVVGGFGPNTLIGVSGSIYDDNFNFDNPCGDFTDLQLFVQLAPIAAEAIATECIPGQINPVVTLGNFSGGEPEGLFTLGGFFSLDDPQYYLTATGGDLSAPTTIPGGQLSLTVTDPSGNWTITVTDDNGCSFVLGGNAESCCVIDIAAAATDETCDGDNDGTITVEIVDNPNALLLEFALIPGGGPYTGQNALSFQDDPVFDNLADGTYTLVSRHIFDYNCQAVFEDVVIAAGLIVDAPTTTGGYACQFSEVANEGLTASCTTVCPNGDDQITWWTEQFGGTLVGTGADFDPLSVEDLVHNDVVDSYIFWAQCECGPCLSDRSSAEFLIRPLPTVKPILGDLSVCPGESVEYSIEGAVAGNTYDWTLSDATAGTISAGNGTDVITVDWAEEPAGNGPYTLTVVETDAFDCSETYSIDVTIEFDQQVACNSNLNITLDQNCEFLFTYDHGLENPLYPADSYTVTVLDEDGVTVPDALVTAKGNYTYMIQHICSGQICWGDFVAEDKNAPTIECPESPDLDFICTDVSEIFTPELTVFEEGDNLLTGNPIGDDNCGMFTITYIDVLAEGDCEDDVITRTFYIVDMAGNEGEPCTQEISIRKPILDDVDLPEEVVVECDAISDISPEGLLDFGDPDAFPTITTYFETHTINQTYCNIGASYVDTPPITLCGGGYKIIRTWTLVDWCTSTSSEHAQIIKVQDTSAPEIVCPDYSDISASNAPESCNGILVIRDLENLSENCSNPVTLVIEIIAEDGTSLGDEYEVGEQVLLPTGTHTVRYTAIDACGNVSETCDSPITIGDTTPPVAICDEHTILALGSDGQGEICWETFDDGSYDNCGPIVIRVKRMDDAANVPFTECVDFDCADVGETIMVRMRVWDLTPSNGYPDSDAGRWNECMIEVEVQDKLDPIITCPPNKELDCQAGYDELDQIIPDDDGVVDANPVHPPVTYNGEFVGYYAGAFDNCSATVEVVDSGSLDNCGEGTIFRRWTVTDAGGLTDRCTQRIELVNNEPFQESDIDWPNDYTTNCTNGNGTEPEDLPTGRDFPSITEDACDLVAVTHEDTVLPITDDACWKILRLWTVIDWCQFDVDNNDGTYEGYWQYTQIIKVQDTAAPTILSSCEDIEVCNFEEDCGATAVSLVLEAEDVCSEDLNYSYVIDAFNDGVADGSAFSGDSNDASGDYPNGEHLISWTVEDGCGNISECSYLFTVSDCKKPTPICINGLATVVMPSSGQIELWDSDFDAPGTSGSFDNCTDQEDLQFRIRKVEAGQSQLTSLAQVLALDKNVTFTCDDLGFPNVELYVIDEEGNWDYCTTYAAIQDNNNACGNGEYATVAGYVETENQEMVEEVTIDVAGSNAVPPFLTNGDGAYNFNNIPMNGNYTVTPVKDINYLNGVTTFDLVLISKHILNIQLLDSPYKIIAADANRSNSVTTFDLVKLRRLILSIDTELAENTSWRFVDMDFAFPNAANPFQTTFPEVISLNDLSSNEVAADFIGVKVGDVNGSAIPNSLLGAEDRNFNGTLVFDVNDVKMTAGQSYTVAFDANDFNNMLGYQFTLNFNTKALDFVSVDAANLAQLSADNFGLARLAEGVITSSWNDVKANSVKNGETLFTVTFEAKEDALLSEVIGLNSKVTIAEAYTAEADVQDVAIAFNSENGVNVVGGTFELFQNQPNPFKATTVISFNLPQASAATLTIYDVSGKVLKVITGDYAKGYHNIQLDRAALSGTGMLYYQLDTDTDSDTKKMILID